VGLGDEGIQRNCYPNTASKSNELRVLN